jgi:hypothetical protein
MSTDGIDLDALLKRLHLPTVRRLYPEYCARAAAESWSHRDLLALLFAEDQGHWRGPGGVTRQSAGAALVPTWMSPRATPPGPW